MSDVYWKIIKDFLSKGFDFKVIDCDPADVEILYCKVNGINEWELETYLNELIENYKSELTFDSCSQSDDLKSLVVEIDNRINILKEFLNFYTTNHPDSKYPFKLTKRKVLQVTYYDSSDTLYNQINRKQTHKKTKFNDGDFSEKMVNIPWQDNHENYLKANCISLIIAFIKSLIQLNQAYIIEINRQLSNYIPKKKVTSSTTSSRSAKKSFDYKLGGSLEYCCTELINGRYIEETKDKYYIRVFRPVFSNRPISEITEKINWIGDKKALYKFISSCKPVLNRPQPWKVVEKCFLFKGEEITNDTMHDQKSGYKDEHGYIAKAIKHLNS